MCFAPVVDCFTFVRLTSQGWATNSFNKAFQDYIIRERLGATFARRGVDKIVSYV